jgi:magnesium transporter
MREPLPRSFDPPTTPESWETVLEPWETIAAFLGAGDKDGLISFLDRLPPAERSRGLSRLSQEQRDALAVALGPEHMASLLEAMPAAHAAGIIEDFSTRRAAAIVEEMSSADQADVLAGLRPTDVDAILARLEPTQAAETRSLLQYPPYTAGGLMLTEYVSFTDDRTIGEVIDTLRAHGEQFSDYAIQYAYIVDGDGMLVGVWRLRDLLLARRADEPVTAKMVHDPVSVPVDASLDALERLFDERPFIGVPVVDASGRLVGAVRRAGVEAALAERETRVFLKLSGLMTAEELRTMPLVQRSTRRLSWLSINIVLNVAAASVIALFQDTLAAVIALAVFLPIISDMSGCSGNQAVAVSIRELSTGLLKPYEVARVVAKESAVGIINGIALGLLLALVALFWQGNPALAIVVGSALALNTLLAVVLGGSIPLLLKGLKLDPALASGPILTTVTDMCGFWMVLGFASLGLEYLT